MQDGQPTATRELTFGEKAVGLTFNPGGNPKVDEIKKTCAAAIDSIYGTENNPGVEVLNDEKSRMVQLAITRIQEGQMWAVKAATWQY